NRISNFFDSASYPFLAVLDFGLPEEQVNRLLGEALELVASGTRYSVRELFGTLFALRHPARRGKENLLAREKSFYCSAFVHHLFGKIGIDLAPEVDSKRTTPEDISRSATPHVTYLLEREVVRSHLGRLRTRVRRRLKARNKSLK